jgi:non-heme chloroperoxidase
MWRQMRAPWTRIAVLSAVVACAAATAAPAAMRRPPDHPQAPHSQPNHSQPDHSQPGHSQPSHPQSTYIQSNRSEEPHDRYVVSSDDVRLHLIEAGPQAGRTILFVPGWAMPAWIWTKQIQAFDQDYHVVAMDPRGQGTSDAPATGYDPKRRADDIDDVLEQLGPAPVVLVAWSLGVLDSLAYVHAYGDDRIAGLVLVDNSVGEEPPPPPLPRPLHLASPLPHLDAMRLFVRGLFAHSPGEAYLNRLTQASLHLPETAARALRSYPQPRSFWRDAVYSTNRPLLYVVRPRWAAQADTLTRNRPGTESAVFINVGHALFVDEPKRFNSLLGEFIHRRVWPLPAGTRRAGDP